MAKVIAKDKMDVPRVWGEGSTRDEAIHECNTALREYLERRKEMKYEDFTFELA